MKKLILLLAIIGLPIVAVPGSAGAVDVFNDGICDRYAPGDTNAPTVCQDKNITGSDGKQQNPIFGTNGILTTVINILTTAVAVLAIIYITLAGFRLITSSSNPQERSNARERIIYALVALLVVAIAQATVRFVINQLLE
jgi:Type IV secretion system pilin